MLGTRSVVFASVAALLWLTSHTTWAQTTKVAIDIKPGDSPTTIEPTREGMLPVAILSTAEFDAATVDATTVRIGPSGTEAEPFKYMSEDVNRDGRADLLILVRVQDMKATCKDQIIRLTGTTGRGGKIEGSETVTTDC